MTEHPRGRAAGWVLLALAGLAIAVVLSVAASKLSTQPIGLSGEALQGAQRLAPQATIPTTPPGSASTSPRSDDHGSGDPDHDDD